MSITQEILDYVALNPGKRRSEIDLKFLDHPDHEVLHSIQVLLDLKMISDSDKNYGLRITEITPYFYGVAFGKTTVHKIICPTCNTENLINPYTKLTSPKQCRSCKTELIPPRIHMSGHASSHIPHIPLNAEHEAPTGFSGSQNQAKLLLMDPKEMTVLQLRAEIKRMGGEVKRHMKKADLVAEAERLRASVKG